MRSRQAWLAILALSFASPALATQPEELFRVHEKTAGDQREADVAAGADGGFAVVWVQEEPGDDDPEDEDPGSVRIVARQFDGQGQGGAEIVVASGGNPSHPAVASLADGSFVVAWEQFDRLWVQLGFGAEPPPFRLDLGGVRSGSFDVATDPTGGFAVVWETVFEAAVDAPDFPDLCPSTDPPPSGLALLGRRFNADGTAHGCTKRITALDQPVAGESSPPRVTIDENGVLTVAWQQGGVAGDVFLRAFDLVWDTLPMPEEGAGEHRGNVFAAGLQRRPAVTAHGKSGLGVVWESGPPRVDLDLALCLDASRSTLPGTSGPDTLRQQLDGVALALEDVIPADRTLRLTVLRFGGAELTTLADGELIDPTSAARLAASIQGADLTRVSGGSPAARCLCEAAFRLTGREVCPEDDDEDLCPGGTETPAVPLQDGRRSVIVLATDAVPTFLALPDVPAPVPQAQVDPPRLESDADLLTCRLREVAKRAREAGVDVLNAVRIPVGGLVRDDLRPHELPPESAQLVDLAAAVFPGGERGVVAETASSGELAQALGRTIAAELAVESGVFGRLFRSAGDEAPEIQINSGITGDQARPDLAADADGTTLVAWEDRERGRISAQLFGSEDLPVGVLPVGGQVDVSGELSDPAGTPEGLPSRPRVAPLASGRFVVVWEQPGDEGGGRDVLARLVEPPPPLVCQPDATTLCLQGGDFRIRVAWRASDGRKGSAQAALLDPSTGYFHLPHPGGALLLVRMDRRGNGAVFEAVGLTDLGLAVTVEDTRTAGAVRYVTRPGDLFPPLHDAGRFAGDGVQAGGAATAVDLGSERGGPTVFYPVRQAAGAEGACETGPQALCLAGGRFRVEARARQRANAQTGQATALGTAPLAGFFSFSGDQLDAALRVVDVGNGEFWIFAAGLSSTTVELVVTDTAGGQQRSVLAGGGVRPVRRCLTCPEERRGRR